MHPQQNYSAPKNPGEYDFITNPQQQPSRSSLAGTSVAARIGIVAGILLILLIGFVGVSNMLNSGGSNKTAIATVLVQQQELIRISGAPIKARQPLTAASGNAAGTIQLSLTTSNQDLRAYATSQKIKLDKKKLISPSRQANDKQLAAAASAGTYEETFKRLLESQLTEYQQGLKTAFNKTSGTKGRELLNKQYLEAALLLQQLKNGR